MFDVNKKEYIIETPGKSVNLFLIKNSELHYRLFEDNCFEQVSKLIIDDILPSFSACTDETGAIHILCQDRFGKILYCHLNQDKPEIKILYKVKNFIVENKHCHIFYHKQILYFFYILTNFGRNHLVFQSLNLQDGKLSEPKLIDYIEAGKKPYNIVLDSYENIYIFYKYLDIKHGFLGYRRYNISTGMLTNFKQLNDYAGESEVLSAATDSYNNLYVCWQISYFSKYQLLISCKKIDNDGWEKAIIIGESSSGFINSSIIVSNEKLLIYWVEGNKIFYSQADNLNAAWSKPQKYTSPDNNLLHCVSILTPSRNNASFAVPGNYTYGFSLAFKDVLIKHSPDLNEYFSENISALPKKIDETKQAVKDLNKQVEKMTAYESFELSLNSVRADINEIKEVLKGLLLKFETTKK